MSRDPWKPCRIGWAPEEWNEGQCVPKRDRSGEVVEDDDWCNFERVPLCEIFSIETGEKLKIVNRHYCQGFSNCPNYPCLKTSEIRSVKMVRESLIKRCKSWFVQASYYNEFWKMPNRIRRELHKQRVFNGNNAGKVAKFFHQKFQTNLCDR